MGRRGGGGGGVSLALPFKNFCFCLEGCTVCVCVPDVFFFSIEGTGNVALLNHDDLVVRLLEPQADLFQVHLFSKGPKDMETMRADSAQR